MNFIQIFNVYTIIYFRVTPKTKMDFVTNRYIAGFLIYMHHIAMYNI